MAAIHDVLSRLDGIKKIPGGFMARCPSHADGSPSLHVSEGDDGRVLLFCHAGCPTESILVALNSEWTDLFADAPAAPTRRPEVVQRYDYTDELGTLLYQVERMSPKGFRQRRPDGDGGWAYSLNGTRRVLYRLPEVLDAVAQGRRIFVVEGEKDADALVRAGEAATTAPQGAGKWSKVPDAAAVLAGAAVTVIADADKAGRRHGEEVAASLRAAGCAVELRGAKVGKDVAEHLAAGLSVGDLVAVVSPEPVAPAPPAVEPPPAEDGAGLLDDLDAFVGRFVAFPSTEARHAAALWIAHAHLVDAFESTPRLALVSPEKGSGKTRTLEVIELLAPRPRFTVNCTAAALFRSIGDRPTLLFDEADTYFGPFAGKQHEELRGLVNAGHRKGAVAYRCVGEPAKMEVREFPAYCAVALAGIGDLPDTILDRSVLVQMRRRAPGEYVEPFRHRKVSPEAETLRARLTQWADANKGALEQAEPELPYGLTDRPADVWEPLIAIADQAGGDWTALARRAALKLNSARAAADPSLGVRLLADVGVAFDYAEFVTRDVDRLSTEELLQWLNAVDDAPWGDLKGKPLDARGLARRLKPYGVRPGDHKFGDSTRKGYLRSDLVDAWARYLPDPLKEGQQGQLGQRDVQERPPEVAAVAHVAPPIGSKAEPDLLAPAASSSDNGHGELTTGEAIAKVFSAFPGTTILEGGPVRDLPLDTVASCRACHTTTVTADDAGPIHLRCRP